MLDAHFIPQGIDLKQDVTLVNDITFAVRPPLENAADA
jgi:hypothetical protein